MQGKADYMALMFAKWCNFQDNGYYARAINIALPCMKTLIAIQNAIFLLLMSVIYSKARKQRNFVKDLGEKIELVGL